MAISNDQYDDIITRLRALERTANILQEFAKMCVTNETLEQLNILNQTDVADLQDAVEALRERVTQLEGYHELY